ncbi:MAG TPA: MmgE/PrpD family protein [Burkholderiales bacterium]|nr:MmgE/PrpD family protein [Burkholderiales bacterium]
MDELSISQRLAAHVAGTRWEDLSKDALDAAKRMTLDTLAVAWAGADAPGIESVRTLMIEEGGAAHGSVWTTAVRLPARVAAFLNSAASAALDFDGMRATERGSVHADSVVLPAALAVAEREDRSGRELLEALVLGNDVVTRLGAASALPHKGWYLTSIYGIFGAAAAAARLMRLDAEATAHAFGLAANHAAATQLPNIERSLAKRYSSSFAAHDGVLAASMAACGITAATQAFEGRSGFYDLYQNGEPALLFDGLGRTWPHVHTGVKRYPSCACNHTAVEAALYLAREFAPDSQDIVSADVTISPYVHRLVGAPFDPGEDPQVAAQFSVQYSVAVAMLRKRFGVADIAPGAVCDPQTVRFARSIEVRVENAWGNSRAATVALTTRRHGRREHHVEHIPGSEKAPLSERDLSDKALDCLQAGPAPLDRERAERLIATILTLETLPDANALLAGVR